MCDMNSLLNTYYIVTCPPCVVPLASTSGYVTGLLSSGRGYIISDVPLRGSISFRATHLAAVDEHEREQLARISDRHSDKKRRRSRR